MSMYVRKSLKNAAIGSSVGNDFKWAVYSHARGATQGHQYMMSVSATLDNTQKHQ